MGNQVLVGYLSPVQGGVLVEKTVHAHQKVYCRKKKGLRLNNNEAKPGEVSVQYRSATLTHSQSLSAVLGRGEAGFVLELFGEKEVGLKLKLVGDFLHGFFRNQKQLLGPLDF